MPPPPLQSEDSAARGPVPRSEPARLNHQGHRGASYGIACPACVQVAGEAREQREKFHARQLTAHDWSQWRIAMFEAGFGAALAAGEREARL